LTKRTARKNLVTAGSSEEKTEEIPYAKLTDDDDDNGNVTKKLLMLQKIVWEIGILQ
jgi:hypothetical protein